MSDLKSVNLASSEYQKPLVPRQLMELKLMKDLVSSLERELDAKQKENKIIYMELKKVREINEQIREKNLKHQNDIKVNEDTRKVQNNNNADSTVLSQQANIHIKQLKELLANKQLQKTSLNKQLMEIFKDLTNRNAQIFKLSNQLESERQKALESALEGSSSQSNSGALASYESIIKEMKAELNTAQNRNSELQEMLKHNASLGYADNSSQQTQQRTSELLDRIKSLQEAKSKLSTQLFASFKDLTDKNSQIFKLTNQLESERQKTTENALEGSSNQNNSQALANYESVIKQLKAQLATAHNRTSELQEMLTTFYVLPISQFNESIANLQPSLRNLFLQSQQLFKSNLLLNQSPKILSTTEFVTLSSVFCKLALNFTNLLAPFLKSLAIKQSEGTQIDFNISVASLKEKIISTIQRLKLKSTDTETLGKLPKDQANQNIGKTIQKIPSQNQIQMILQDTECLAQQNAELSDLISQISNELMQQKSSKDIFKLQLQKCREDNEKIIKTVESIKKAYAQLQKQYYQNKNSLFLLEAENLRLQSMLTRLINSSEAARQISEFGFINEIRNDNAFIKSGFSEYSLNAGVGAEIEGLSSSVPAEHLINQMRAPSKYRFSDGQSSQNKAEMKLEVLSSGDKSRIQASQGLMDYNTPNSKRIASSRISSFSKDPGQKLNMGQRFMGRPLRFKGIGYNEMDISSLSRMSEWEKFSSLHGQSRSKLLMEQLRVKNKELQTHHVESN